MWLSEKCREKKEKTALLNGQFLDWSGVKAGVSQGLILCPLLFII